MKSRRVPLEIPLAAAFIITMMGYAVWAAFTGHGRFIALRVGYGPDSALYLRVARYPVWSMRFLAYPDGGPFFFLLLAKLSLRNLRAIVLVQSAIASASWLFLAHTVATALRRPWLRTVGFVAVLLIALSPGVLVWNATIATESLATSLLVLVIALAFRVARGRSRYDFTALLVVLVAFACTRDTNSLLLLVIAAGAAVVALARASLRRRAVAMLLVCVLAAGANMALAARAHRWYHPLTETIAARILGSRAATGYFVARGMPYDPAVRALHTDFLTSVADLDTGPQYARFRAWIRDRGRATYVRFLAGHPDWLLKNPYDDRKRLLAPNLPYGVIYHNEPRGAFVVIGALAMPGNVVLVEIWMAAALVAALVIGRRRSRRPMVVAAGVVAALVVPAFLAAWHGDALEVDRHSLGAAVQLRIVLWVVALLALDRFVARNRSSTPAQEPIQEA